METARTFLGYRAAPLKASNFAPHGHDWDGGFVAHIIRTVGLYDYGFISTTAALQWATRARTIYTKPRAGDVAVFAFSQAAGGTGQAHVGIVSDVRSWNVDRSFQSIEAQVPSPSTRENQDPTGVFEWTRYEPDVIGFIRLTLPRQSQGTNKETPTLRVAELRLGVRGKHIERLQTALGEESCLSQATRGVYDRTTASALRAWERKCASVGDTKRALDILAERTGLFQAKA